MKPRITATLLGASLAMLSLTAGAYAASPTKIIFPKGSYCASYSGNFSNSKTYSVYLLKGQDFEVKAANMEDGILIKDAQGEVSGEWIDDTTYYITTRMKGKHYVTVRSPYGEQNVEFCAY